MTKKLFLKMIPILIILLLIVYYGRNKIIEILLEKKLTSINNSKVEIGKVDFRPFSDFISIFRVEISSKNDNKINAASIREIKINYKLQISEKKVIITDSSLIGVELLTIKNNESKKTISSNEPKKNTEIISDNSSPISKNQMEEILKKDIIEKKYKELKEQLVLNNDKIKNRMDEIKKSEQYKQVKKNFEKVFTLEDPLKIFDRDDKDVENLLNSAKELVSGLEKERKIAVDEIKQLTDKDKFKKYLEDSLKDFIDEQEKKINDLDSILSEYLTKNYEKEIYDLVLMYRDYLLNLKKMKTIDAQKGETWEVIIKKMIITVKAYGLDFSGEINEISNRISNNKEDITVRLTAWEDENNAIIEGKINLKDLVGNIYLNIPSAKFEKMPEISEYIKNGNFGLSSNLVVDNENIDISGDFRVQNIVLSREAIERQIDFKLPLFNELIAPVMKNIKIENAKYSYDSIKRGIVIKSELAQKILSEINKNNGALKKDLIKDVINKSHLEIEKYSNILSSDKKEYEKFIENLTNGEIKTISDLQEKLEKLNKNSGKKILNKLDKFLRKL
ncbi:MAG: hypothetical protein LBT51_01000 [Fusobacteriaceae bacterium]|nr:hypothetical protein [Fusobacteriaceae bacterium]